jgi:hypothetical protein
MDTTVPPTVGPEVGVIEETTGGITKLKLSELFVPPGLVILIRTVPVECAGVVVFISVSLITVKLVAGVVPKTTLVVPMKPLPVMVRISPPAVVPKVGLTLIVIG